MCGSADHGLKETPGNMLRCNSFVGWFLAGSCLPSRTTAMNSVNPTTCTKWKDTMHFKAGSASLLSCVLGDPFQSS